MREGELLVKSISPPMRWREDISQISRGQVSSKEVSHNLEKLLLAQSAYLLPSVLGPPNLCLTWVKIKIQLNFAAQILNLENLPLICFYLSQPTDWKKNLIGKIQKYRNSFWKQIQIHTFVQVMNCLHILLHIELTRLWCPATAHNLGQNDSHLVHQL